MNHAQILINKKIYLMNDESYFWNYQSSSSSESSSIFLKNLCFTSMTLKSSSKEEKFKHSSYSMS